MQWLPQDRRQLRLQRLPIKVHQLSALIEVGVDHDLDGLIVWPSLPGEMDHIPDVAEQIGRPESIRVVEAPAVKDRLVEALWICGGATHIPGQADAGDIIFSGQAAHQWCDRPFGMDMMMRVQVDRRDACRDHALQLGPELFVYSFLLFNGESKKRVLAGKATTPAQST